MRLITPAVSWQLAARMVAAYDGPMDEIIWTPQTVTAAVLELAGDLAEHLREPGDVIAVGRWLNAELDALPGRIPAAVRKMLATQRAREQLLPLVEPYAAAKAAREVIDYGDQIALAARIAGRAPGGRRGRARPVPGGPARRVPGHQPRPAGAAALAVRRRAPGHRGRRPVPVHLRLARRERGQPAPVPRRLPGGGARARPRRRRPGPGAAAVDQLPQHRRGCWTPRPHPGRSCARGARRAAAGVRAGPR